MGGGAHQACSSSSSSFVLLLEESRNAETRVRRINRWVGMGRERAAQVWAEVGLVFFCGMGRRGGERRETRTRRRRRPGRERGGGGGRARRRAAQALAGGRTCLRWFGCLTASGRAGRMVRVVWPRPRLPTPRRKEAARARYCARSSRTVVVVAGLGGAALSVSGPRQEGEQTLPPDAHGSAGRPESQGWGWLRRVWASRTDTKPVPLAGAGGGPRGAGSRPSSPRHRRAPPPPLSLMTSRPPRPGSRLSLFPHVRFVLPNLSYSFAKMVRVCVPLIERRGRPPALL
jgi:hypothetical protein